MAAKAPAASPALPPAAAAKRTLRTDLALAILPSLIVLIVLFVLERFHHQQRLLFASLAPSAFLIYLDPHHGMNRTRTVVLAQMAGAVIGSLALAIFGAGFVAAAAAMIVVILVMILLRAMHPPAIATALTFAFRPVAENQFVLFALALGLVAILIGLQRASVWLLDKMAASAP